MHAGDAIVAASSLHCIELADIASTCSAAHNPARKPSADSGAYARRCTKKNAHLAARRLSLFVRLRGNSRRGPAPRAALGALHLDGTHSPHHLRAKPQPPPRAAAPRAGLLDKLRAELPAAARATPPPTGAAPSAQERREAERLEAERRAEAEVAAARAGR